MDLGSVVSGYMLEHDNLSLLFQPVELLINGGMAMGDFSISSTPRVFGMVLKNLPAVLMPKSPSKDKYRELLSREHPGAHQVDPLKDGVFIRSRV